VRSEQIRVELQSAAKGAGVFAPHVGTEFDGHGLDIRGRATVFDEAGYYSLLGPLALNIAASDEGNVHLLEAVATEELQERYLRPLAADDIRSSFAHIDTLDESLYGGYLELLFDKCVVGVDAVLGEVDQGFRYAQVRLGPAWMTHCMRWLGIARRAQDIAVDRATQRHLFGTRLSELGMTQQAVADNEIDIAAARGLILRACWELDQGWSASRATSITKTICAEAVRRVVGRSLQICGSLGVSGDILLGRFLREVRPFRIYDGPSETHRWSIARRAVRQSERATR
jgi:alkylation response protein AidB-like acyl-CoA dehydrogenase